MTLNSPDLASVIHKWVPFAITTLSVFVAGFSTYSAVQTRIALIEQQQQVLSSRIDKTERDIDKVLDKLDSILIQANRRP